MIQKLFQSFRLSKLAKNPEVERFITEASHFSKITIKRGKTSGNTVLSLKDKGSYMVVSQDNHVLQHGKKPDLDTFSASRKEFDFFDDFKGRTIISNSAKGMESLKKSGIKNVYPTQIVDKFSTSDGRISATKIEFGEKATNLRLLEKHHVVDLFRNGNTVSRVELSKSGIKSSMFSI